MRPPPRRAAEEMEVGPTEAAVGGSIDEGGGEEAVGETTVSCIPASLKATAELVKTGS